MIVGIFLAALVVSAAGDPVNGKLLSKQCTACHGETGISIIDHWPNLRGQKAGYISKELLRYQDRKRKHLMMEHVADSLTKQDMEDLGAYFSQLSGS